jgi:hypothetical protein
MPVPKKLQKTYGKIVGHMINSGMTMHKAKAVADKAISHMAPKKK